MKKYIEENRFDELKEVLKGSNLEVFKILADALEHKGREYADISFNSDLYEEEWMEGIAVYLALDKSEVDKEVLKIYRDGLVGIVFRIHHFIRESAVETTDSGVYFKDDFYINPQLRTDLQTIIELFKKQKLLKSRMNMSIAKAQLSSVMNHRIEKFEVGRDMLQCAESYEARDFKDKAVQMYEGVLADFECESVRLSSGLFPQISYVDTRPMEEIAVFEQAKELYEALTGRVLREPNRVHVNSSESARKLEEASEKEGGIAAENRNIEEEKPLLLQSESFTISGYKIPALSLKKGEMLRLWVESFSHSTKSAGDSWGRKKMQEVIEVIDGASKQLKFCPNQIKRGFVDWFKPISVGDYVKKNFDWSQKEVDQYLAPLGIKATYLLKNLGTGHQKVFAIVCAFQEETIPCFDYYGLSLDSIESLTSYVKTMLKKGKSAIVFDNLPNKPANPDSDGIVNLIVGRAKM